jgi:multiple sugar transport system ATP-binding protein
MSRLWEGFLADIRLREVNKRFGDVQVINNVNLEIADGEFCVFVGPSGCGKSTLLRMVAGLEDISTGRLDIGGRDVTRLPPSERGVAMVFQSYALYPHMTVYDNMAFGLQLAKTDKGDIDTRVRRAADILHLGPLLQRLPKQLSGGQRQRVAIGRAIVRKPGVFLFDEPLSNLDAALRVQTRIEIAKLHANLGASMIYVTHDQVEAMTLADKIVLLNAGEAMQRDGSVAQVGKPLDLYHRPANLFVAGFIGSPKMNVLPGTIASIAPDRAEINLRDGSRLAARVNTGAACVGDAVTLGIRPEHMLPGRTAGTSGVIQGCASHVEHLGDGSYLYLESPALDGTLTVREEGDTPVEPGEVIGVMLPEQHCHLFNAEGRAFPRHLPPGAAPRPTQRIEAAVH